VPSQYYLPTSLQSEKIFSTPFKAGFSFLCPTFPCQSPYETGRATDSGRGIFGRGMGCGFAALSFCCSTLVQPELRYRNGSAPASGAFFRALAKKRGMHKTVPILKATRCRPNCGTRDAFCDARGGRAPRTSEIKFKRPADSALSRRSRTKAEHLQLSNGLLTPSPGFAMTCV
jgi:hypothetical protein